VLRSLDAAEVHVVLTVRDVTAIIPSRWLTEVHNGSTISRRAYTRRLRAGAMVPRLGLLSPHPTVRRFSLAQDIGRILRILGRLVPPEHLHVVTVPTGDADRRLLWHRFASVVGVDPEVCSEGPQSANESLRYPSTELLRPSSARVRTWWVAWTTCRSTCPTPNDVASRWRSRRRPRRSSWPARPLPRTRMVKVMRRRARRLRSRGERVAFEPFDVTAPAPSA
jgi:hypothetical protein